MKTRNLFFVAVCFVILVLPPTDTFATDLVNINTADLATLDTLPGVGPSIAQSIIDNRPYASIEEVSRAVGIGEPGFSSYEKIKDLITVGDTASTQTQSQTSQTEGVTVPQPTTTTTSVSPVGAVGAPLITVHIGGDATSMVGGGSYFSGSALGTQGAPLKNVRYVWNFGDGITAEGQTVFHVYTYPGKYSVSLAASSDISAGLVRHTVEASAAHVALTAEADASLTVLNQSAKDIDIGLWTLTNGPSNFVIPKHTTVLANKGVRFSFAITRVVGDQNAKLLYPNQSVAASATLSTDSPMRGEAIATSNQPPVSAKPAKRIQTPTMSTVVVAPTTTAISSQDLFPTNGIQTTTTDTPERQLAAAVTSGFGMPLSTAFLGLAGLLIVGVSSVWYVRYSMSRLPRETTADSEEFDIE